jgi:ribonuclease BN (tRNA processing enzyme)
LFVTFQIRILGSEPAWPSASRACSGFLVQSARSTILVDCGTGVFERLRAVIPPEELTGVVISHLHFDHWVDLVPFRYYLAFEAASPVRPSLHLPPGANEKLHDIIEPIDPATRFFADVFETSEYDPRGELRFGELLITFRQTRHPIETYAFKLTLGTKTAVYSADTGWAEYIADFAQGADLFLCEATWGADDGNVEMHLSGAEAGRLAELAKVKRLLLIHLAETKAEDAVRAAQREYGGSVQYAEAGRTFTL